MKIEYKVEEASIQHVNGEHTAKELVIYTAVKHEDGDGSFEVPDMITVPVPWNTPLGDKPELKGKIVTIDIPL